MLIAVILHEFAHSLLVWYAGGACDSPRIGGIGGEGGNFVEKTLFGGITAAELKLKPTTSVTEIGVIVGDKFYPISKSQSLLQVTMC
jgi:hypothetical protein